MAPELRSDIIYMYTMVSAVIGMFIIVSHGAGDLGKSEMLSVLYITLKIHLHFHGNDTNRVIKQVIM